MDGGIGFLRCSNRVLGWMVFLYVRYARLFDLAINKCVVVAEMFSLG